MSTNTAAIVAAPTAPVRMENTSSPVPPLIPARRRRPRPPAVPPPDAHGIAELLTLVGEIRRLAFGTLPPIEALGRIRDAFHEYDGA
jgi:hypothetical protein